MRGNIGLFVVLMALAALIVSESQSFGGGHRRRGHCGSCSSACNTGCAPGGSCNAMPAAPAETSPSDAAPPAPHGAAVSPPAETPQAEASVTTAPSNNTYYSTRRARRSARR